MHHVSCHATCHMPYVSALMPPCVPRVRFTRVITRELRGKWNLYQPDVIPVTGIGSEWSGVIIESSRNFHHHLALVFSWRWTALIQSWRHEGYLSPQERNQGHRQGGSQRRKETKALARFLGGNAFTVTWRYGTGVCLDWLIIFRAMLVSAISPMALLVLNFSLLRTLPYMHRTWFPRKYRANTARSEFFRPCAGFPRVRESHPWCVPVPDPDNW